ncbi:MAG: hypothetical protein K1X92_18835 [Bacteroidia bacterium]|nr:hypothetical protein [Bacteroidia bacterium]
MKSFSFFQDGVVLHHSNGLSQTIYFNANSGKLYWRYKIDTITNVQHPCIYLGKDARGRDYVIHNHYHYGSAFVDTWHGFSQGQTVYDNYLPSCKNPPLTIIQNALNQVILKKRYDVLSYNCQTTVNLACNNDPKSQSVDTWMPVLVAGMGVLVIGGILAMFNE